MEVCALDCCNSDSENCVCDTKEAYAKACLELGVKLTWKQPGVCGK